MFSGSLKRGFKWILQCNGMRTEEYQLPPKRLEGAVGSSFYHDDKAIPRIVVASLRSLFEIPDLINEPDAWIFMIAKFQRPFFIVNDQEFRTSAMLK